MPGTSGIVTRQDGRYGVRCEYCDFEGNDEPDLASWDQDEIELLANQHRRSAHRFTPVGWRAEEINGLGLGLRRAPAMALRGSAEAHAESRLVSRTQPPTSDAPDGSTAP